MDPPGPKDSAPVEAVSPPAIDTEERNPDQDGQKVILRESYFLQLADLARLNK